MRLGGLAALLLWFCAAGAGQAQEAQPEYTADEFVRAILRGPQPCPKGQTLEACEANPKTRRFTLGAPPASKPSPAAPRRASVSEPQKPTSLIARILKPKPKLSAQDVLVTFAVGSSEITPQGQANLRSIAEGLNKAALAEVRFEVAGFTDVSGPSSLNQELSQRRAETVKVFLVGLNVRADRLEAVGYGSQHLIDPEDPTSELNRRVELHRLN